MNEPTPRTLEDRLRADSAWLGRTLDAEDTSRAAELMARSVPAGRDRNDARQEIEAALAQARSDPGTLFEAPVLAALTKLRAESPAEWQRFRAKAKDAKVQVGELDRLTAQVEADHAVALFEDVTPWSEPVDGAALLVELRDTFARHVVLPKHTREALALWTTITWTVDAFDLLPMLHVSSPEKRCGKSTLLSLLSELSRRPLLATSATPAALFRVIEKAVPTLLLDEADTWMRENEELRGIINGGHSRKTARVLRTVGDDHEPAVFSTFCPKVLSGIGRLADTIEDRSITIAMRRKLPGEKVQSMRKADFGRLRSRCARWAADHGAALRGSDPALPPGLNDRAADNWAPLLAIAEAAGADWPELAREAAKALSAARSDDSARTVLLADIHELLSERAEAGCGNEPIPSADLVMHLISLEDRPWSEWRHGKPLTGHGLARLLEAFDIHPRAIREAKRVFKGYEPGAFADAFSRYPAFSAMEGAEQRLHGYNPVKIGVSANSQPLHAPELVTDEKRTKPYENRLCNRVTVEKEGTEGEGPESEGEAKAEHL